MKTLRFTFLFLILTIFVYGCSAAEDAQQAAPESNLPATIAAIQTSAAASTLGSDPDLIGTIIAMQTAAAESTLTALPRPSPTSISTSTLFFNDANANLTLPTTPTTFLLPAIPTLTNVHPLPRDWHTWEIVPNVSPTAMQIIEKGLALGNNAKAFSKVGDCQSVPGVFLGVYATDKWTLPEEHQSASAAIEHFQGSFRKENETAKNGYAVSSVLNPTFSDPKHCQSKETPLDCELRLRRPIVVFVVMGTSWWPEISKNFEKRLRQIVDVLIQQGSLPILVTKPDNVEGDETINLAIAQVAYDYDLPLINIWKAFEPLPAHGLRPDGIYMSSKSWNTRNLYALVTLEKLRKVILSLGY